jgi:hypothetical protein
MGVRDIDFDRWPEPAPDICESEKKRVWLKRDNTKKFYDLLPEAAQASPGISRR